MRFSLVTMALVTMAACLLTAARADATRESELDGNWRVVQMQRGGQDVPLPDGVMIVMELHVTGHRFRLAVRAQDGAHDEHGSWKLERDVLTTTTTQRKVERMTVQLIDSVTLVLNKGSELLVLRKF